MRVRKALPLAAALASGVAGIVMTAMPAQAAGDTARYNGCAAHWRTTAAWNECKNSPGTNIQLHVDCSWDWDHTSGWKWVKGTVDPVQRHECANRANGAYNGFK